MPLAGTADQPIDHPYFVSLKDLDTYCYEPRRKLPGILPYIARSNTSKHQGKGKLLVCHDYKGGYQEKPRGLSYSFNFWSTCDIFIYFSHHRVTIPPPGWINAAHRQGVKMLGTLIFEPGGEEDCLRLLVGNLPQNVYGPAKPSLPNASLPISSHYAKLLAELAHERGFDGYLLNFECALQGRFEQTRALSAWITILRSELCSKVGSHAEVIWYDSVVVTGQLAWQDRLNSYNLPFFLSSDSFFSNYTWRSDYPNTTAQYFLSLDSTLTEGTHKVTSPSNTNATPHRPKLLSDIYMGVDVWGRGSHGGGGLGCYRAISHISPDSLGLSVALFGQAWTWETMEDKPGFSWEKWFKHDSTLWVGPVSGKGEDVEVPEAPRRKGELECDHGPFKPVGSFFDRRQPPDPCALPLHTTFSPGVGHSWFVDGLKVHDHGEEGWTDIDKQGSLGNLVWPRPELGWEVELRDEPLPAVVSAIDFKEAWNGGSSLIITVSFVGSEDENAAFRCIWVPIQSVAVRKGVLYEARVVYKTGVSSEDSAPDIDTNVAIHPLGTQKELAESFTVDSRVSADVLPNGWNELILQYQLSEVDDNDNNTSTGALGVVFAVAVEDPSQSFDLVLHIGQLNVYPAPVPTQPQPTAGLLWARVIPTSPKFTTTPSVSEAKSQEVLKDPSKLPLGTLQWDFGASLPPLGPINIEAVSAEDPTPLWVAPSSDASQSPGGWFPGFNYFNIYVLPFQSGAGAADTSSTHGHVGQPEEAIWIGTTGIDGQANKFWLTRDHLAGVKGLLDAGTQRTKKVRFFIQGVDHYGRVMKWENCVFVDHTFE